MQDKSIQFTELIHKSLEFDAAYEIISRDIPPEYLETRDFLRNRLRVRDEGPQTEQERVLVQEGYTLHLIAAKQDERVVGAVYGHLISRIGPENKSVGFVTYISVHPDYRRRGVGTGLINAMQRAVDDDARRMTGKPIFGMVYEIEEEGKEESKAMVSKLGAKPLDIVYYQPALRLGYAPERMNLWFQPVPTLSSTDSSELTVPADTADAIVRNMLVMEYVGPEMKGFDLKAKPYTAFQDSIKGRSAVGFIQL
jgi:GNAT superfamily N-acetyltransferase